MGNATSDMAGTFTGIAVRTGAGGGLASSAPGAGAPSTHYHAARMDELGDVVLAVTRRFDAQTVAPLRIELRAFSAQAAGRAALTELEGEQLLDAPGAIAFAEVALAAEGDEADERRPATLRRCVVTDAAPTADAARAVATWLRTTWETELAFGSWPAVRGSMEAFAAPGGGAVADWAEEWLRASEHRLADDDTFLKVLASAWLEPIER